MIQCFIIAHKMNSLSTGFAEEIHLFIIEGAQQEITSFCLLLFTSFFHLCLKERGTEMLFYQSLLAGFSSRGS